MLKFVNGSEGNHSHSLDKIQELETKYSIEFPVCLKEYYQKYDGEKIKLTTIMVDGYECEVAKIIPIIAESMSFEYVTDNDKADGFIPNSYYPLARDRGGNFYYWDSYTGKVLVVFVDDFENPFLVSNSVKDFFDKLNNASLG